MIRFIAVSFVLLVGVVLFAEMLPVWVRQSGGDVLIVLPIYAIAAIAWPVARPLPVALGTFAFASAVEFSQLYHGPTIDAFRRTFLGQMTIGSTFVPSDFACYAIGTLIALAFDLRVARRFDRRPTVSQ